MAAKKQSKKQKGSGVLFLTVALGAALAAGAGYYATHKDEVDKEAKKRIDELAKTFKETKKEVEKRVNEVWGEVSDEAVATYMDARAALLHALEEENLAQTGKMIRKKYDEVVDAAVKHARKSGILDEDVEEKLSDLFKMDWEDVQAILASSAKKLATDVTKEAKKAVSEVSKRAATKKRGAKKKSVAKKTVPKSAAKKKAPKKATRPAAKKPARKTAAKKPARRAPKKK